MTQLKNRLNVKTGDNSCPNFVNVVQDYVKKLRIPDITSMQPTSKKPHGDVDSQIKSIKRIDGGGMTAYVCRFKDIEGILTSPPRGVRVGDTVDYKCLAFVEGRIPLLHIIN